MAWVERAVPPLLLVTGAALVGYSVATGQAQFYLFLIVPVVTGHSIALALGVVALVVGLLLIPWSFAGPAEEPEPIAGSSMPSAGASTGGSGGVVLVGPIPFFWGSWRSPTRARYWLAVGIGVALIVGFAALLFLA